MRDQMERYRKKLVADRSAADGDIAFAAQDDILLSAGAEPWVTLAEGVLARLNCLALVAARPSLPFADFLIARADAGTGLIVPSDTETRTFLHDIPFLRRADLVEDSARKIAGLLGNRKGIIAEGLGIVANGTITVEQAYINYSSVFHATFVKYLQDLLRTGFLLPQEPAAFSLFCKEWLRPLHARGLSFRDRLDLPASILDELTAVGRYTVERGLVDSFFGNISCRLNETIYISQTASSLDHLSGCIDPVPMDNSSTCGITASSELLAHRKIYEETGARVILHGHPKFAVVMSMQCEKQGCPITNCWRDCEQVRLLGDTPVVSGEIGAGGLARRVPPVIGRTGRAVVYGHGVFTIGDTFEEAFSGLVDVENWCREEYFRLLRQRHVGIA